MSKTVADIYVRLSDKDRENKKQTDESESIANQKKMLTDYCKKMGWQINAVYSDEDMSGADRNRPGFIKMLDDCQKHKCNTVLCKTLSRFSRDMEIVEKYIHGKFCEWNIRFVSLVDNIDTEIATNKKARQINGLINEWYLDDLSENIKATLSAKRKKGEFVGSFAPYGYIPDSNNKNRLIIDKKAAETVKRIFSMYISGYGYTAIAKALNQDFVPTPCQRKKELGLKYYNSNFEKNETKNKWTVSSVYTIIKRYEYTGATVQGKQRVVNYKTGIRQSIPQSDWDIVENMHEPIISKETYFQAEHLRKTKSRSQKTEVQIRYTLSNKLFCGECGNIMWKSSCNVSGKQQGYIACKTRKLQKENCNNAHQLRTELLENAVMAEINKLTSEFYDYSEVSRNIERLGLSDSKKSLEKECEALTKEIQKNDKRIKEIYCDKIDGIISADEYISYKKDFLFRKEELLKRIEILKSQCNSLSSAIDVSQEKIIDIVSNCDLNCMIAEKFVEKIYIFARNDINERKIIINWKI